MGCTDSVCLPVKGNMGSDFQSFNHNQGSGANQQQQQICQGRKCYQNNRRGQGSQTCFGGICRQDNGNGGSNQYKPSRRGQFQPGNGNRGQYQVTPLNGGHQQKCGSGSECQINYYDDYDPDFFSSPMEFFYDETNQADTEIQGQNHPGTQQSFQNPVFTGNGGHGQVGTRNGGHAGTQNDWQNQAGTGIQGQNQPGTQQSFPNPVLTRIGGHNQGRIGNGGHSQGGAGIQGQNQPRTGNRGHSQGGYQQKCSNGSKCQVNYGDYDDKFFTDDFWS